MMSFLHVYLIDGLTRVKASILFVYLFTKTLKLCILVQGCQTCGVLKRSWDVLALGLRRTGVAG